MGDPRNVIDVTIRARRLPVGAKRSMLGVVVLAAAMGAGSASAAAATPESVAELSAESALRPLLDQLPVSTGQIPGIASLPVGGTPQGQPGGTAAADRGPVGWQSPVKNYWLSARFGEPGSWSSGYHTGLDFVAPTGAAVRAPVSGVVVATESPGAYGNLLRIRVAPGTEVWFAHLRDFAVVKGQRVEAGQLVGHVGMTGRTTGSHLHFEVRVGEKARNPERYLWPDGRVVKRA